MQYEVTRAQVSALGITEVSLDNDAGVNAPNETCTDPNCPAYLLTFFDALKIANAWSKREGTRECYALSDCVVRPEAGSVCGAVGGTIDPIYECEGFRLPTEAEWEYAARAGTRQSTYAGPLLLEGDPLRCVDAGALNEIGWYCANSRGLHPGGQKRPNAWGLYDMSGNALELTSDEYNGLGYGTQRRVDPGGTVTNGLLGSSRGGSVTTMASFLRSSMRYGGARQWSSYGLRLARTVK